MVAADIVDAEEDALAVLLLVSGSEIALEKERKLISFFGRIQTYLAPIFISSLIWECFHFTFISLIQM